MTRYLLKVALTLFLLAGHTSEAQRAGKKISSRKDYLVTIATGMGSMKLVLSDLTPLHKENFINLAREGFYNDLLFHRTIENFMIQGGDPNSRNAQPGTLLGSGSHGERIPAEFNPSLYHKKGVLAAARDNNPEKASSGCQFYIVQGRKWKKEELDKQVQRAGRTPSDQQVETYLTEGGTPHLDGNYTVFGEVVEGLDVIDKIASVKTDGNNRPLENVSMKVTVDVWKKKKISKTFNYKY